MTATGSPADYLARPLAGFLDDVAAPAPTPGGGAVSALVVGLAAGLAAMAAGFSRDLADAGSLVTAAEVLRARVTPLAAADAAAYTAVLVTATIPKDAPGRQEAVRRALSHAADVPLEVAEVGAAVVRLAERLERLGNRNLRGDAATARLLAAAAVKSAATLVELNLSNPGDARVVRARALAAEVWTR